MAKKAEWSMALERKQHRLRGAAEETHLVQFATGELVTALTCADPDGFNPSRRVKGRLHKRWVEVFRYTQVSVGGELVEPLSIRRLGRAKRPGK